MVKQYCLHEAVASTCLKIGIAKGRISPFFLDMHNYQALSCSWGIHVHSLGSSFVRREC